MTETLTIAIRGYLHSRRRWRSLSNFPLPICPKPLLSAVKEKKQNFSLKFSQLSLSPLSQTQQNDTQSVNLLSIIQTPKNILCIQMGQFSFGWFYFTPEQLFLVFTGLANSCLKVLDSVLCLCILYSTLTCLSYFFVSLDLSPSVCASFWGEISELLGSHCYIFCLLLKSSSTSSFFLAKQPEFET